MSPQIYIFILILFFILPCKLQANELSYFNHDDESYRHSDIGIQVEKSLKVLSSALEKKDRIAFISLSDSLDVHLVRIFTSGNLGGRGEPLSQITNLNQISKEMDFAIEGQTAFSVPSIFASLPINSFESVLRKPLLLTSTQIPYDQWAPLLMQSLKDVPEVEDGAPVILVNESLGYWVFADVQTIDDMLVGGFAVFKSEKITVKLVAMIELL